MAVTQKIAEKQAIKINLEEIAEHIRLTAQAGRALQNSRLKSRAVYVLLQDITGLPLNTIKLVLDALPQLEREYLK